MNEETTEGLQIVREFTEQEIKALLRQGKLIKCTETEYRHGLRDKLQTIAGAWIEQNQGIYASIALQEVKRLDRELHYLPGGDTDEPNDDMPPISGITFDPYAVWPEEPKCWYQPCAETLVLVLVTQKQANENDWTGARFFCKAHGEPIHVHAMSKLPSGHIVGIVKEPTWDDWEARETDA